jgi:hypothetical protein
MKSFLIGIATVFLYMIVLGLSFDTKMYLEQIKEVRFIAQEVSATSTLFLDLYDYSQGEIIFNEAEALKAIDAQVKELLKLDATGVPLDSSYWQEPAECLVYFYDDSKVCRVYKNGVLQNTYPFEYPYLHQNAEYNHVQTVAAPIAIVNINAGKPRFRFTFFQDEFEDVKVKQTASYTWDNHN